VRISPAEFVRKKSVKKFLIVRSLSDFYPEKKSLSNFTAESLQIQYYVEQLKVFFLQVEFNLRFLFVTLRKELHQLLSTVTHIALHSLATKQGMTLATPLLGRHQRARAPTNCQLWPLSWLPLLLDVAQRGEGTRVRAQFKTRYIYLRARSSGTVPTIRAPRNGFHSDDPTAMLFSSPGHEHPPF
jgi:hypothetical protein